MSSPAMVPMIAPDGTLGTVPQERVNDAVKEGFKVGQEMIAPDGQQRGLIPLDRVHDAIGEGFSIAPPGGPRGSVTNDVGNQVVVPNPNLSNDEPSVLFHPQGESFADTMKRAAAYGKAVTQGQIDKEMQSAPGKTAEVLGAAPVIGAGGAATLALAGEAPAILREITRQALEYSNGKAEVANKALEAFQQSYPELAKLVGRLGFGKTAGTLGLGYASWELFRHITGLGGK